MAGPAVLPREAIAFLRAKGLKPSRHWLSVWREEHASAFTVAQMTRQDLLRQTHRELQRVLRKGETFESFQQRLQPWLEAKGWAPTGRGGDIPKRLRRIYHTNLRTAHLAGQWDRIQRTKRLLPWLVYGLGPSEVHREQHAAWAGLCLRVDDPFWRTHMPPNGWGCKCWVRQVAEPPEGATTKAPPIETRPWTNPATGETVHVPRGIDPGWDYNAAEHAGLGTVQALTDRVTRLAAPARQAADALPGPAAREHVLDATAAARRRLGVLDGDLQRARDTFRDPNAARRSGQLREIEALEGAVKKQEAAVAAAGRRAVLRSRPAAFRSGHEPSWADVWAAAHLERRWEPELGDWRRMVAPKLLREIEAPRRVLVSPPRVADSSYVAGMVRINSGMHAGTMVHELSHLLEADRETFNRAVAFLSRRTAGDMIEVINERGDLGRRDKFRNPKGRAEPYPGRVYEAARGSDAEGYHRARLSGLPGHSPARDPGDRGDVDVYATEVLSVGMEWMWQDPAGFAAVDPEYFDFIWDTVVRGTR